MNPDITLAEQSTIYAQPARRAVISAGAAILAFASAAAGEYLLRGDAPMWQPLLLYMAAAILLGLTATRFVFAPAAQPLRRNEAMVWRMLAVGVALAATLAAITFATLLENLRSPWGPWLWLTTIGVLIATGLSVWRLETPTDRWHAERAQTRNQRIVFAVLLAVILAAGIAARVSWLDRIPLGINPDEGDRTATAMQVLRGTTPQQLFEAGWYRISMMYFYLLAGWLKLFGIGYVQARLFTALWGVGTLCAIIWAGARNWSWRVALWAGAAFALTGVTLQFARETSEAGPTAALWTLSVALMLEGARRGRSLAWIGAGLEGGYSLYFYPSGRTWPVLAALIGVAWLLRWIAARDGDWLRLLRGFVLAAVASVAVCAPFFAQSALFPDEFALRFAETSVLRPENAQRLDYVDPAWSTTRLLGEQVSRSLGIFARYGDAAGFWPTNRPLVGPVLALLLLLGLCYGIVRVRDPRAFAIALWALVGMTGMVLTVETPNLQRMATALPALFLGAAVLIDDVILRVAALAPSPGVRRAVEWFVFASAAVLLVVTLALDTRFYFGDYAQMRRWEGWNQEGNAMTLLPPDTLHVSIGTSFHMVNSGWVRLLAPDAQRGGVRAPGAMLPLPEDGSRGLAFLLYPNQNAYLPWLRSLYPAATAIDYRRAGESHYFDFLYVPAADVAATRGVQVSVGDQAARVASFGAPPPFEMAPGAAVTWSATLRVPQQWNYAFRLDGAATELSLDGTPLLAHAPGEENAVIVLNLARGDHGIMLAGGAHGTTLEWARVEPGVESSFAPLALADLTLSDGAPHGFAGRVEIEGLPDQSRQDNTLAACCLGGLLDSRNRPLRLLWDAYLAARTAGDYTFQVTLPGPGSLRIDDTSVASVTAPEGGTTEGSISLQAGEHPIMVEVTSQTGANGSIELIWTPPSGEPSILPASALRPGASLFAPPLSDDLLRTPDVWPGDIPLETIE